MDCILYINKTGCQWRMIPKDFPPYNLVFYYFTKWKREGVFEDIMDTLREKLRIVLGREESPSVGIIDSRSAKTSQHVDKERGIDGNKKLKGRKDQVVVDTQGLPMVVSVHEANVHDSKGAESALKRLANKFPRLRKILADGGYRGDELRETNRRMLGCQLEVVLRPDESPKKFNVIPLRWIVERSFAWLYNFRRVALDYEFYSESSEAMIQIAFSKIMLNKLST
jgi:putative transposase